MPLTPVAFEPGVNTSDSTYLASKSVGVAGERLVHGQWVASTNVRFWNGQPQKRYGWDSLSLSGTTIRGTARAMRDWLGVDNVSRTAIGASNGLFLLVGSALSEITPLASVTTELGSITFGTTSGSRLVVVTSSKTVSVLDWLFIGMSAAVGGVQIIGYVQVTAVGVGNYTVAAPVAASSTTSGAVTADIGYPRRLLDADPITTVMGSRTVFFQVPMSGWDYAPNVGDVIVVSGASNVGGISPNGTWLVTVGLAAGAIGFDISTPAISAATGGGAAVVVSFNVSNLDNPSYLVSGWTLAPYGGLMSVCNIGDTLYFYDPAAGGRAYPIYGAPTKVNAHFVTPERFIVALGTASSPLQMAWCDQQDPNDWTSTAQNTANSGRNLIGGSFFVSGIPVADGVSLILTDRCAFLMQYTGDNEVYSTPRVSDNSGGVSPWCAVVLAGIAYWRGTYDFWIFSGSVTRIPSNDVHETIFTNQQTPHLNKCTTGTTRQWNEIWFFDVSAVSTEIDRLTVFQIDMGIFTVEQDASLPPTPPIRTAWMDANRFFVPFSADASGKVYMQETGVNADGVAMQASLSSSLMDIAGGDASIYFAGMIPDFAYLDGSLDVSVTTKYYPGDTGTTDATQGPITASGANFTDYLFYRQDGKLFSVEFSSTSLGDNWRMGQFRVDISPQSARR